VGRGKGRRPVGGLFKDANCKQAPFFSGTKESFFAFITNMFFSNVQMLIFRLDISFGKKCVSLV
jgi:hypothetical protein